MVKAGVLVLWAGTAVNAKSCKGIDDHLACSLLKASFVPANSDFCSTTNEQITKLVLADGDGVRRSTIDWGQTWGAMADKTIGFFNKDDGAVEDLDKAPSFYKSNAIDYKIPFIAPPANVKVSSNLITVSKSGSFVTVHVPSTYTDNTFILTVDDATLTIAVEIYELGSGGDTSLGSYSTIGTYCPGECPDNCPEVFDSAVTLTANCTIPNACENVKNCDLINALWQKDKIVPYTALGDCDSSGSSESMRRRRAADTVVFNVKMPPPYTQEALDKFVGDIMLGATELGKGIAATAPENENAGTSDDDLSLTMIIVIIVAVVLGLTGTIVVLMKNGAFKDCTDNCTQKLTSLRPANGFSADGMSQINLL